jgi:hypothetical protein
VRDAFAARGHDAWSCDLLPSDRPDGNHFQCDVLDVLGNGWDLMIAHPTCTYLTIAAEWAYKEIQTKNIKEGTLIGKAWQEARVKAIEFVKTLAEADIDKIAIEKPTGVLSTHWRQPDQFIQPFEYGNDASKRTCLWLKNLPNLVPTNLAVPRLALSKDGRSYAFRWCNQTDSGQNKLPPSEDRWKLRSTTYDGWANAMAEQWG